VRYKKLRYDARRAGRSDQVIVGIIRVRGQQIQATWIDDAGQLVPIAIVARRHGVPIGIDGLGDVAVAVVGDGAGVAKASVTLPMKPIPLVAICTVEVLYVAGDAT